MIYYTENYKDKTPQHQVFNVAKQISQAIKELSLLEIILEEIGKQIKAELGFEFVNISLVVPEQGTIESVYGTGIAEKLTDLAKHYLEKDKALRDIQADIFQTRRTEVISGEDERFDPWIYETFNHERLVRVFTPIILVRDESGNVREDWFDRCQWKKPIEKNGKRQHTVFEMQLPNEFPDEAIQVIGTVEAGYHSNQKQIDDKQVKALVKLVARRTFDIRKAQLPYVLETIAEDARQILQADLVLYISCMNHNKAATSMKSVQVASATYS